MATITPAAFRAAFPAFKSATYYPDAMISMWAAAANVLLDPARWGDLLELGQNLFIAHNLILDGMTLAEGMRGGLVGFARSGAISTESGDKVSVGFAASGLDPTAGHWTLTYYGSRYSYFMKMVGAGGIQVGPAASDPGFGYGQGWPGPVTGLWPY